MLYWSYGKGVGGTLLRLPLRETQLLRTSCQGAGRSGMRRALLFSITVMLCLGLLPLGACGRVATATPVAWRPASTAAPTATGTAAPTLTFTPEPTRSATDTETPAATPEPCTFVLLDDITAPHEPRHGDEYAEALSAGCPDRKLSSAKQTANRDRIARWGY